MLTYQSNISSFIVNLKGKLHNTANNSAMLRTVATDLLASNLRRIHNDGQAVDGTRIGSYNAKTPLYVNPNKSPRKFAPQGKTGNKIFASTGQPHKTKYFTSYKTFRAEVGRSTARVNLQLTGKLRLDFKMVQDGAGWSIGFMSHYGAQVSRGNENKYGKQIWGVTMRDYQTIDTIVRGFVKKELNA